ncbi:TetR/AcrR family transcriptional regulator [Yoonia sp. F2084L]|uniref:TetR/AcrR family transcriptional regulator n=1 Tax=Yoonia sp. F2084L TaxID=2926419 RepID=UPI001FF6537C|nr:TetR/AcrR family transcriptional regulator [Yoonia sp. F2084L]MCK0097643.1 TetR/AcrR family transcriptional regulator [Yoonia sp. F2084L]
MARKQGSHSDITGPKVRDAALRLIARHGYAAVSMRQIAAEVGIQAGALYNYTPDKQTLLFDLMKGHMTDLLCALDDADLKGTALARLEGFTRFHIQFHLPKPDQVFVSYMELRNLSEENFAAIEVMRRQYEDALESILRAGEAEGVFAIADTRVTTMALIAMLTGIGNWYRAGGRLKTDTITAIYWDMVRRSVTA